jgi:hypothetical protein
MLQGGQFWRAFFPATSAATGGAVSQTFFLREYRMLQGGQFWVIFPTRLRCYRGGSLGSIFFFSGEILTKFSPPWPLVPGLHMTSPLFIKVIVVYIKHSGSKLGLLRPGRR